MIETNTNNGFTNLNMVELNWLKLDPSHPLLAPLDIYITHSQICLYNTIIK